MVEDVLAVDGEPLDGQPLLTPAMCAGKLMLDEPLSALRTRSAVNLRALPDDLRELDGQPSRNYPVRISPQLQQLAAAVGSIHDPCRVVPQRGTT
jgi:hypothetical protein